METDRRLMPRYNVALPIAAGKMHGTTRSVAVSGVSFVVPAALPVDEAIAFSITLSPAPAGLTMHCRGVVKRAVRIKGGQFEIVATIDTLELKPSPA
jgi:hypothetical protein